MNIPLRPMTDTTAGTCDWGGCDEPTAAERYHAEGNTWLAVCERHAGRTHRRPSPGRAACAVCGKHYALTTAGTVRAHDQKLEPFRWARCSGSGRVPKGPTP